MKRAWIRAALVASALLPGSAVVVPAQKTAEALLQEGVNLELVVGDLQKAITRYREVVDGHASSRRSAAQALANLGRVYEKLGAPDASDTYQRLVRDFPDQGASVRFARERLAALGGSPATERGDLQLRKVWASLAGFSSVSPDGRHVAFQDWGQISDPALRGNADLAVFDTKEKRIRRVTDRPSLALVDVYVTDPFIWSSDGAWLAYGQWVVGWTHRALHIVRSDGSGDRRILDNRQMEDARAMAFSSDNRFVLAALKGWDKVWRIATVSLRDSTLAFVKTLGVTAPAVLSLSPDDRFIAYAYAAPDSASANTDIFVLAVDGSSETRVAANPANDASPVWTPDGERLVFVSDRSGQRSVWAVHWRNGGASGEPERVHPHLGTMQLRGVLRSGALYFSADAGGREIFEATVDLATDSVLSDVKRLTDSHVLNNMRPDWSPDGSKVAWLSLRGMAGDPFHLVVKTLSSGSERAYALPFPPGDIRASRVEWSSDGRVVTVQGRDVAKRVRGSFQVDVETGAVTAEPRLREFAGIAGNDVTEFFFVDDRQAAMLRSLGIRLIGQTDTFLLEDLAFLANEVAVVVRNGVFRVRSRADLVPTAATISDGLANAERLSPPGHMDAWRLSPDGTRIAAAIASDTVMMSNVLHVVPLAGGPARELDRVERSPGQPGTQGVIGSVRWTPDGKHILYAKSRHSPRPGERGQSEIWMVDPDGGAPRQLKLALTAYQLSTLSFHPDGRRIAFTDWRAPLTEVWVADGLPWQRKR